MSKPVKIWGVRSDLIGDIVTALPVLNYLSEEYPNSYKYFSILKKVSQVAPFFIDHPQIDRIKISDLDDGFGPEDEKIKSSCDVVVNTRPPVVDPDYWYNLRGHVDESILMAGFDPDKIRDKKPRLHRWFNIERKAKTIGIWPFAGYGKEFRRSPSLEYWKNITAQFIADGYKIIHYGHPREPIISDDILCLKDRSLFEQVQHCLGCDFAIGTDSGSQWLLGAYGFPQIILLTNWCPGHFANFYGLAPENCKDLSINLFAPGGCDSIPPTCVFEAKKALEVKFNTRMTTKVRTKNEYYKRWETEVCDRDKVFNYITEQVLGNKPARILEIGAMRSLDINSKAGDGWSSFFWAAHIAKYGGKLVICDISQEAIDASRKMLINFAGTVDIDFVCGDGLQVIEQQEWDLVYLDGGDDPNQTYEQYKKVNRQVANILGDDANRGGKFDRVRNDYTDYQISKVNAVHEMIFFPRIDYGEKNFTVGSTTLNYVRELSNRAYRNERAAELALARYFTENRQNVIEVGDVCPNYSFFKGWDVLDPFGPYEKSIRKDIMDFDYRGRAVLCISTIEHVGVDGGYEKVRDTQKAIDALNKIVKESDSYLLTFPLGEHRELESFIRESSIPHFIMRRKSFVGERNEWVKHEDSNDFSFTYGHFHYQKNYYGNALAICVITNLPELL